METGPTLKTDVWHFNRKEKKRAKLKDCSILKNFTFSKNDFFVVKYKTLLIVCASRNDELYLLRYYDGKTFNANEVMSEFRKGYLKNKIDDERLSLFLDSPLEHEKKFNVLPQKK